MNLTINKPDSLGAIASTLCMLHCFATPFLIIALAGSASITAEAPIWWTSINYIFLVIAFFAVLSSTQTTSRSFMKPLFWTNWIVLSFVIVNEQIGWLALPELVTYAAATLLVLLHLYHRRYGQCEINTLRIENG
ncbi:MAG: MerC domain-containing protein [Cyanothece sp. SIO1E1]|nr:MerC domain-containing protein [Cyanothece sp. SIO1E1]